MPLLHFENEAPPPRVEMVLLPRKKKNKAQRHAASFYYLETLNYNWA